MIKLTFLLLSLCSTWGGFEFYHQMREAEFLSFTSIISALASVALVLLGSFLVSVAGEL